MNQICKSINVISDPFMPFFVLKFLTMKVRIIKILNPFINTVLLDTDASSF